MIYHSSDHWREAQHKRVCLFGMSGLGKTHISNMLRRTEDWFHYSVDYRIGTRYMGEAIADNAKRLAMQVPLLRDLLLSDSIYIGSNITFENLDWLSSYLGKPGDPDKGGLTIDEYKRRQAQHHDAERAALLDTPAFMKRGLDLYAYPHFVCDSGGSICEVVDANDPADPILTALSQSLLMVWIEGTDDHTQTLIERFNRAPKPMCYRTDFLARSWDAFLAETGSPANRVDPDAFIRFTYAQAMAHRQPLYAGMAKWGVTVRADDVALVRTEDEFTDLIANALDAR